MQIKAIPEYLNLFKIALFIKVLHQLNYFIPKDWYITLNRSNTILFYYYLASNILVAFSISLSLSPSPPPSLPPFLPFLPSLPFLPPSLASWLLKELREYRKTLNIKRRICTSEIHCDVETLKWEPCRLSLKPHSPVMKKKKKKGIWFCRVLQT